MTRLREDPDETKASDQQVNDHDHESDSSNGTSVKTSETSLKRLDNFAHLIDNLMSTYEKYIQIDTQYDIEEQKLSNHSTNGNKGKQKASDDLEYNNLKRLRANTFEKLTNVFDEFSFLIANTKRDDLDSFLYHVQLTNIHMIRLYEFILNALNKQLDLNSAKTTSNNSNSSQIVLKIFEFVHVLITSQSKESEDDEWTIICCDQLAHNFNFTSPISHLLVNNFLNSDSHVRMAFSILNKLSADNSLFAFDIYIKQLVNYVLNRIVDGGDCQPMFIQFLANILRNNKNEAQLFIKSFDKYKQVCRQLTLIIRENNPNLILNSLIILLKLHFDNNLFMILWPTNSNAKTTGAQQHTSKSNDSTGRSSANRIFEPIDLAMRILCQQESLQKRLTCKFNALNFLTEFVACESVLKALENDDDYSNVFLFKLNELLTENDLSDAHDNQESENAALKASRRKRAQYNEKTSRFSHKLPSTYSIKILKILNELASSSNILANKLLQIAFNTAEFIENKENELTKKLKKYLIISAKTSTASEFNLNGFTEFYSNFIDSICTQLYKEKGGARCSRSNHSLLNHTFFEFMLNLFNRFSSSSLARSAKSPTHLEQNMNGLLDILLKAFNWMHSFYLDESSNYSFSSSSTGTSMPNEESCAFQIYFFVLGLIDAIQSVSHSDLLMSRKFVNKLGDFMYKKCWLPSSSSLKASWTDEYMTQSAANTIITSRLMIRIVQSEGLEEDLRREAALFFKKEDFVRLLALVTTHESIRTDLNKIAYEILFDLNRISNYSDEVSVFHNCFHLDHFVKLSQSVKSTHLNQAKQVVEFPELVAHVAPKLSNMDLNQRKMNNQLDDLFEFYNYKLSEQKRQEAQLINTLNQYFSNSLLKDVEFKALRDQIQLYAHKETQYKSELQTAQQRAGELEKKFKELNKENKELKQKHAELEENFAEMEKKFNEMAKVEKKYAELSEQTSHLNSENKKLSDLCESLKRDYEHLEKSSEESIENLQRTISNEINAKKEMQTKLKEMNQKLQSVESKRKEVEEKLNEKSTLLDEKTVEFDSLKSDYDKIKSILSYVKDNFK